MESGKVERINRQSLQVAALFLNKLKNSIGYLFNTVNSNMRWRRIGREGWDSQDLTFALDKMPWEEEI